MLAGVGYGAHRAMAVQLQKQPIPHPAGRDCRWGSGIGVHPLLLLHGEAGEDFVDKTWAKATGISTKLVGDMPWSLLSSPLPTSLSAPIFFFNSFSVNFF